MYDLLLLNDLEYAHDMGLAADSMDELESLLQTLDVSCREISLTISIRKSPRFLTIPSLECPA